MSENRVEGAFQNVAGKVQDAVGYTRTQVEGKARQVAGKVQGAYGKAADQAQDIAASVSRRVEQRPLMAILIAGAAGYVLGRLTHRR